MQSEAAVIARICHDLITPFNAINLGLEAFEMSRDESLLASLRESVDKANVIMKFMRELFSDRTQTFCHSALSLKQLVAEYLKFYNINFDLVSDMESVASIAGKIIMYMAIVAKEISPFGGNVFVKIDNEKSEINTRCSGRNIAVPQMSLDEELNHKSIIRHKFLQLLQDSGFELNVYADGSDVVFSKKMK